MGLDSFLSALTPEVGARAIIADAERIRPWLTDWRGRWTGRSAIMLEPDSSAEVASIVRLAGEHRVALVPQGGNSGMVGGATPPEDGSAILLSLRRMHRIRETGPGYAVAEAGVILAHFHEAAAEVGARFPLDLGASGSATLGGLASTNAGGTQVLRFGTMRRQVLGMEAVLAGGLVHDGLAGLKKDNRGVSIDQLLIGTEGTLGIITALRLALVPGVSGRASAWIGLDSPQAALDLLQRVEAATDRVEAFELIPDASLQRVLAHIPMTRAPLAGRHRWHVLIEAVEDGSSSSAAGLIEELLTPAHGVGLVKDAAIAASEEQAQQFWRIRHSISEAERASGPAAQHDISLPINAIPAFLTEEALRIEQAFPGAEASGFGHLGDGNIHFHVRAPRGESPGWADRADGKAASRLVHDRVTALGGSISAEHGIGQMKKDELSRLSSPARLQALRAIKQAMDPNGIFNPGKLID